MSPIERGYAVAQGRMTGADRRKHVLDTARAIVLAEGFHAVTLERVASEGGISRPLLYKLFGGLPGLVTTLVDRETEAALDGLYQVMTGADLAADADIEAAIAAVCAMLDATALAPLSWQILLNPPQGGPIELYDRIAAGRAMARSSVEHVLKSAHQHLDDPELTARLVHLLLEDLVRLHLSDPGRYPRERVVRQVQRTVTAVLSGTRAESAP